MPKKKQKKTSMVNYSRNLVHLVYLTSYTFFSPTTIVPDGWPGHEHLLLPIEAATKTSVPKVLGRGDLAISVSRMDRDVAL